LGASKNIAKNTLLLIVGLYSGRLLALFLRKKMTFILGPEGIGIWTFAVSVAGIMQTVSNFGLGNLLTREISKTRAMTLPLFWTTLKVRWLVGTVCYAFLLGFAKVSDWEALDKTVVLLMGLAIFVESTGLACDAVLQAHEKVQYQSLAQVASALLYFGLGWWALEVGYGIVGVVWANLASRVIRLTIMMPLMFRFTGPWRRDGGGGSIDMRGLMQMGLPIFLATTFATVYTQIDSVMLKNMISNEATGIYGQGRQALNILVMLPGIFGLAFFPAMTRYGEKSPADAARLGERALRFILVGIVPVTLLVMFISGPIIHWFEDSARWDDSITVMMIGIWGLPLHAIAVVMNRLLLTANREKYFVVIGLVPMVANLALNMVLIPRYSYYGAAVATVLSLMMNTGMHIYFLRGTPFLPPLRRALLGPMVAAGSAWGLSALVLRLVAPSWGVGWQGLPLHLGWGPFIVTSLLMLGLYSVMLWFGKVIKSEDLQLLRELKRS